MSQFPIRGQVTVDDYRAQCRSSDWWAVFHEVFSGQRGYALPPGGVHLILLGMLIVVVAGGVIVFLMASLLAEPTMQVWGAVVFSITMVMPLTHCAFMLPVSLGFIYAQERLVYYLAGLFASVSGLCIYGTYNLFIGDVDLIELIPLIVSLLVALAMLLLSQSAGFTSYAEFLRVKRIYIQELKKQARPRRYPMNPNRQ